MFKGNLFTVLPFKIRIIIPVIIVILLIFIALLIFLNVVIIPNVSERARLDVIDEINLAAGDVLQRIYKERDYAESLAYMLKAARRNKLPREILFDIFKEISKNNDYFLSIYSLWEVNAYDNDADYINKIGHDDTGRFIVSVNKSSGIIKVQPSTNIEENTKKADFYVLPKNLKKLVTTNPYFYSYEADKKAELIISNSMPIVIDGVFKGVVGIDMDVEYIDEVLSKVKLYKRGYVFLFSNNGTVISYPDKKYIGKNIEELNNFKEYLGYIKSDKSYYETKTLDTINEKHLIVVSPILQENAGMPWGIIGVVPESEFLSSINNIRNIFIFLLFLSAVIITFILFSIVNKLYRELGGEPSRVIDVIREITNKNLNTRIVLIGKDRNSLLFYVSNMVRELKEFIKHLISVSKNLSSESNRLNEGSKIINSNMEDQAVKTTEIATSASQMVKATEDMALSISELLNFTNSTVELTDSDMRSVDETTDSISQINDSIMEARNMMKDLQEESTEIESIIVTIREISDQVNLLALNASIEAARAGEAGRGFAVVAEEVRKLAEKTKTAATNITEQIGSTKVNILNVTNKMDGIDNESKGIVKKVDDLKINFNDISHNILKLQEMIEEITAISEELASSSSNIGLDVENISKSSNETSLEANSFLKLADKISEISQSIQNLIKDFKI